MAAGTGNDTVAIYDVCDVGWGEQLDGGSGVNFPRVVVQDNSCLSECVHRRECEAHVPTGPAAGGSEPIAGYRPGVYGCEAPRIVVHTPVHASWLEQRARFPDGGRTRGRHERG